MSLCLKLGYDTLFTVPKNELFLTPINPPTSAENEIANVQEMIQKKLI
jgi:hypothetical protein